MDKYPLPPTPTTSEPEAVLSHCLERIVSFGDGDGRTRSYWQSTAKAAAQRFIDELPDGMFGRSWNHGVGAGVLFTLLENEHEEALRMYAVHQLDSTHVGLWGQEGTSHNYPHPVPYLAAAFERRPLSELRSVLRAHAFVLALLALPRPYRREHAENLADAQGPYRDDRVLGQHVCCGGMRSQWTYRGNVYLSYALDVMRGRRPPVPTWRDTDRRREGWPNRVMLHTRHDYLSDADRDLIEAQVTRAEVVPLVAAMNELGVRSRATLHALRWDDDQAASYYETNTHSSTPPIMAQSQVRNHGYRTLGLHPERHRGAGANSVGEVTAWRAGDRIFGRAEGVVAGGDLGAWPPCTVNGEPAPGSRRGTVEASIPIPQGEPLYEVVIDREGVRIAGAPPLPPVEDDPRVIDALARLAGIAGGSDDPWIQQGIRTGAEVLRRIARGVRRDALSGSRDLTSVLERPAGPTPPSSVDDPRVIDALVLFIGVADGSNDPWIQQGIRTGAEVLQRIARADRQGAIDGSRGLTSVLES